ncbi:hypothetical protein PF005_g21729 [Phytophthora fragariae]|uniref:CBM1 domain-containing protein n=1 Tax=Phytophthora fragariae TaxID=53985 RepID=A0A6A3WQN5_9STRA|nr:hypothetical protein PF003_g22751 [Phytophthora fragariae]KAE8936962.1 hypothetical protein PF009_g13120 [Phytophthora fragariae]KAE8985443.1 hypothetical protein PF011_g20387 [Phytophthora fragariae]KAE9083828.1 hypothetical protein PF010_g21070 [Phytophthora fragariae]KAE9109339.1 hypothetical protein PF007_g12285 [Phytophthora fragariae]
MQASVRLRIHKKESSCTITNESQCDGQNWTGSTCCVDPDYECRWSDDGQIVKRCQAIDTTKDYIDRQTAYIADWGNFTSSDAVCSEPASVCLEQSGAFWRCMPETLPPGGAICRMKYDEYDWYYPHCPSGEYCKTFTTLSFCSPRSEGCSK